LILMNEGWDRAHYLLAPVLHLPFLHTSPIYMHPHRPAGVDPELSIWNGLGWSMISNCIALQEYSLLDRDS
jgi:hypothetical protein